MPFEPCGVITLTTDFGLRDPFVATMKGRILARYPRASIVDITHDVPAYWPGEAGFWLSRSWRYFPDGSVHVAVIDPGVGTRRDIIVAAHATHVFMAPDNGLLAPLLDEAATHRIYRLNPQLLQRFSLDAPSATFHGRDIFAPLAAELAAGRCQPEDLGEPTSEYVPGWIEEPHLIGQAVHGVIVTVDHFGNLITNVERSHLSRFTQPVVHAAGRRFALRRTYGDVRAGEYLALLNAFGVIELARAERSAAEGLGLGRGAPVSVTEGLRTSQ